MNHQWLVSGVGRSGTSSVYKSLLAIAERNESKFSFFYEPYLWGEKIWRRRLETWAGDFGVTSALNPTGLFAHQQTPLFLRSDTHSAHDMFSDEMFGAEGNVLAKIIRGAGRLEYYLKRYPDLKIVHVIRNPLDCINSALGLFSFFGDEFHVSDRERFFRNYPEHDPSQLTDAQMFGLWWRKMNEASLRVAKENPDRVFVLPYEAYVSDPEAVFGSVLEFLGVAASQTSCISFSDPAGPITKTINICSQDVIDLLEVHDEYFEQLNVLNPEVSILDSDGMRQSIKEKYAEAPNGSFSPFLPWDVSPLLVRRNLEKSQPRLSRQLTAKIRQVERLRKKRQINLERISTLITEKESAQKQHANLLTAAKRDLLNQQVRRKKVEAELQILHKRFLLAESEKTKLSTKLKELEYVLAPRLKTLLTLRPLRYVMQQRNKRSIEQRSAHLSHGGENADGAKLDLESDSSNFSPKSHDAHLVLTQPTSHTSSIYEAYSPSKPLGIALFAYDRFEHLEQALKSLEYQSALKDTVVWIDGDQGNTTKRLEIDNVERLVRLFPVKKVHRNRSNFGFRKTMLLAMREMMVSYDRMLFLEDDCFPTRHALNGFSYELDQIDDNEDVFSVYGHPFLIQNEAQGHGRFQGWGWATTRKKLAPVWEQLLDCYMMTEDVFIEFAKNAMTDELRTRIDITPGRQPTDTLSKFFAWDETLCLLTAMRGMNHMPTKERLIFNCGAGDQSTHFKNVDYYRKPPFNMISRQDVWNYF